MLLSFANMGNTMKTEIWQQEDIFCSTDKDLLQPNIIHDYLSNRSYWAKGRTLHQVKKSIMYSECFGIYRVEKQIGFARVVSDFTIYAYILDVFVLEEERGNGIGKFIMECIMNHPQLINIKRWMLGTEDAQGLYRQLGFDSLKKVENHMEKLYRPI